jgi:hypothetical protein
LLSILKKEIRKKFIDGKITNKTESQERSDQQKNIMASIYECKKYKG